MLVKPYRCLFHSFSEQPPLRYQVSFTYAEESIIQTVITLGICSSNHYSAFLSHAAFLPSPGVSVIYRGSTTMDPIRSLYFVNNFGTSQVRCKYSLSSNETSP